MTITHEVVTIQVNEIDARKAWIDNASAVDLLRKWRFAEIGDPMFQDAETTEYYQRIMNEKIATYAPGYVSKRVGW